MAVLKNRAKMSTSTTGTGTITLGSAETGYQTFADAGVADADVVRYARLAVKLDQSSQSALEALSTPTES